MLSKLDGFFLGLESKTNATKTLGSTPAKRKATPKSRVKAKLRKTAQRAKKTASKRVKMVIDSLVKQTSKSIEKTIKTNHKTLNGISTKKTAKASIYKYPRAFKCVIDGKNCLVEIKKDYKDSLFAVLSSSNKEGDLNITEYKASDGEFAEFYANRLYNTLVAIYKERLTEKTKTTKKNKVNSKYTHFAVLKNSNKIVNGWDFKGISTEDLNIDKHHYFYFDLEDMEINPKNVSILTKATLIKRGINPFEYSNWTK